MALRSIILIFLLLQLRQAFPQQQTPTDSIESLIRSIPSDTTKLWLLNNLVIELRERDNNKAVTFAYEAKHLAEVLSHEKGLAIALENLGWILYRRGDYTESFTHSIRALQVAEVVHDTICMARALNSIGAVHYEQKQYDQALNNYRKAYHLSASLNNKKTMARSLNNMAFAFSRMDQLDSALYYVTLGMKMGEDLTDKYTVAFSYRTLGDIYLLKQESEKALESFFTCYDMAIADDNTFLKVSTLHRIGKVYKSTGDYDKALSYFFHNVALAKKYNYKEELERSYKLIADCYRLKNDINSAFHFQSKYLAIHDSLADQRQNERMSLLEHRFNEKMSEARINLLTKEALLKEEEIHSQKLWLYFTIGCVSLLLILALVLVYNVRYANKIRRQVEEKNQEIQAQTLELKNINSTKDKIFSIISHDLRSPLSGLKSLMELVETPGLNQQEFVKITKALRRNLDSVYEDLDNLLMWSQNQLKGLQALPESFRLHLLVEEKIALFKELAAAKNIAIHSSVADNLVVYADRNHISLVLRNLLGNAIKFNRSGGSVTVSAVANGSLVEVSVEDTGIGMDKEELQKLFNAETHFTKLGTNKERGAGIGLLLTKEFVETNKGSIVVKSESGKGTKIRFTLSRNGQEALVHA